MISAGDAAIGGINSAPGEFSTQCTGHSPPWGANELCEAGCQSFVNTIAAPADLAAWMVCCKGPNNDSVSDAASAPPSQKSRCTSTTINADFLPFDIGLPGSPLLFRHASFRTRVQRHIS